MLTAYNMQSVTSNAVARAISYSDTEHIVGYWIDGTTPVYEKTFYFTYTQDTYISFSLPSGKNLIGARGYIRNKHQVNFPIPYHRYENTSGQWYETYIYAIENTVYFVAQSSSPNYFSGGGYLTITYI